MTAITADFENVFAQSPPFARAVLTENAAFWVLARVCNWPNSDVETRPRLVR
jgi:hypothetical protein